MNDLQLRAVLAGLLFGIWPLCMNRSGLSGNVSSAVFGAAVMIIVSPFAIRSGIGSLLTANWLMVAAAGITGALGLLAFNGMLAKATPQSVGAMFVVMIVAQTVVPAAYHAAMNGHLEISKAAGFVFALAAAILLTR